MKIIRQISEVSQTNEVDITQSGIIDNIDLSIQIYR